MKYRKKFDKITNNADLSRLLYSKAKIMYDLYFADSYKKLHDESLAQYEVLKNCQKLMIFMISNFER